MVVSQTIDSNKKKFAKINLFIILITTVLFMIFVFRYISDFTTLIISKEVSPDFAAYYYASQALTQGRSIYAAHLDQDVSAYPYVYPPTLAILLIPLSVLPVLEAQRIWAVINTLLLVLSIAFSMASVERRLSLLQSLLIGCVVFGLYPVYTNLKLGQVSVILLRSYAVEKGELESAA